MKLLSDTWLVFRRYFLLFIRNPAWVVIGVLQPLLYLILFAPLLKSFAQMPGFPRGGAYNVFVPGLLTQLGLFGGSGVGFALIAELRFGVIERFRVTPVSRLALLLGRAMRDVLTILIQSAILVVLAIPFGLNLTLGGALVMIGLVALIGLIVASIAYALALALKSEDSYAPLIFTASLPLLLLSGVLLPLSFAPAWLQHVAQANPLSYAVDGARAAANADFGNPSLLKAIVILVALALVSIGISARSFNRAVA